VVDEGAASLAVVKMLTSPVEQGASGQRAGSALSWRLASSGHCEFSSNSVSSEVALREGARRYPSANFGSLQALK